MSTENKPDEALTEMLPCPFCGFEIDVNDPDAVYPLTRDRGLWQAGCIMIAGGCDAQVLGGCASDAIDNWNRRVVYE